MTGGGSDIGAPGEPTPVGGYLLADDPVEINVGRPRTTITVRNTGDRPIQVGSHYHFFEVNKALEFDRAVTLGQRLDIAAGTAIRFEPGDERQVTLVPVGGTGRVFGFANLFDGRLAQGRPDPAEAAAAMARATSQGFRSRREEPGA